MKAKGLSGFDRELGATIYEKIKAHSDKDPITMEARQKRER